MDIPTIVQGRADHSKDEPENIAVFLDNVNIENQVVTIRGACKKQLRASKGANVTIQRVEHVGSKTGIHARAYILKRK